MDLAKDGVITIGNDGGDIKETNYFQTPQAGEGIIFFSVIILYCLMIFKINNTNLLFFI